MSGPKRKKIYEMLASRDGERCFIGGESLNYESAVIDHWNNNNGDNRPSNLHLLCRSMNAVKNSRSSVRESKELLSSVSVKKQVGDGIIRPQMVKVQSAEFLKNLYGEPLFRHLLFYNVVWCVEVDFDEIVDCGAEFTSMSQASVRRYVDKVTSRYGLYHCVRRENPKGELIRLKARWETFRNTNKRKAKQNNQVKAWREEFSEKEAIDASGKIIPI